MIKKFLISSPIALYTLIFALCTCAQSAHASDLSSPSFNLEAGEVEVQQVDPSTFKQDQKKNKQKYIPQVLSSKIERSLSLSLLPQAQIFNLSPNTPAQKSINLTVTSGENQGYQLTIAQEATPSARRSPPWAGEGGPSAQNEKLNFPQFMGDSQDCQAAKNPCSWVASSTYGLGFRLETPQLTEFMRESVFKRIPAIQSGEPQASILEKHHEGETKAKISLKANLPKKTLSTLWQTTVTYTLLPTY